jgi:hypothetical protein
VGVSTPAHRKIRHHRFGLGGVVVVDSQPCLGLWLAGGGYPLGFPYPGGHDLLP